MPEGCAKNSFSPEIYEYYGDADTILKKIDRVDLQLKDRRVYFLTVEDEKEAEIRFFEWSSGDQWKVSRWRGAASEVPREALSRGYLTNRGVHCVGEQSKGTLQQALSLSSDETVPGPASSRAAFQHTIREFGSDFIRVTVSALC